MQIYKSF